MADLIAPPRPRFINRQQGSATRLAFDTLLECNHIDPSEIDGYAEQEHTHMAIAARIASGERDVGIGESSVADKFSLGFTPLVRENFYLGLKRELQDEVKETIMSHFKSVPTLSFDRVSKATIRQTSGLK